MLTHTKLESIRDSIINSILYSVLYFIPIAVIAMTIRTTVTGWMISNTINLLLVTVLFIVGIKRNVLPTKLKSFVFITIIMLVGVNIFLQNGLLSFGPIYFLTAIGLSMILFDKKEKIGIVVVVLISTFLIGLYIVIFNIVPKYNIAEYMVSPKAWVSTIVNISILVGILYFAFSQFNKELIKALEDISIAEKQLIQQSKNALIGQMISNIAHQWRQPINNISLISQHLEFAYNNTKNHEKTINKGLNDIFETANYMSTTIESFRIFLKPNGSNESFNIIFGIDDALKIVNSKLLENQIVLAKNIVGEDIFLQGICNRFMQIILNLLGNSIDALCDIDKEVKKINLNVRVENKFIIVEIEDNGGGIDEKIIDKIFEPFYSTKKDTLGTGLGLYIVKDILENDFNGVIKCYNSQNGVIFRVEIPVSNVVQ